MYGVYIGDTGIGRVQIGSSISNSSWGDVQKFVRKGLAPELFPIGYEFVTPHTVMKNIAWRVVGHDHHAAADESLVHTMTLEMKQVYGTDTVYKSVQFDNTEFLYYAENGLAAGTYHFTLLAGYDLTYGGGKTLSFTITQPVPVGGGVVFAWAYHVQSIDSTISTYANHASLTAIETVPVIEAADGVNLGTTDGKTLNMNHVHRMRYGSNNYAQSGYRQWLNSTKSDNTWWTPQTKFDRPLRTYTSSDPAYAPFSCGFSDDFLSVLQPAVLPCRTNSIFEISSLDNTVFTINQEYSVIDRFFPLSRPEVFGTWDSVSYKDGTVLNYYDGMDNVDRIKYDVNNTARYVWLRSPYPGGASSERITNVDGSVNSYYANSSIGAAAACIIA